MKKELENLSEILRGGTIKRYHTLEIIGEQSVASHSWGVAIIVEYLDPEINKNTVLKALTHDVAELSTGDIPAPVKWEEFELVQALKQIEQKYEQKLGVAKYSRHMSQKEKSLFKQADMFELLFFCVRQRRLGNANMNIVFSNGIEFLANQDLNERGSKLLGKLMKEYGGI
jgi:5'-deoxynucleotidase YfbR-like HD superfamily hydrolase